MCCDCRGTDIDGDTKDPFPETRPYRDDFAFVTNRNRDLPVTLAKRHLQFKQRGQCDYETFNFPVARNGSLQALEIAGRVVHVRLANLDKVGVRDGVDFDVVRFMRLSHDLAVYLAGFGYVDRNVTAQGSLAAQSTIVGKAAPFAMSLLCLTGW